MTAADNFPEPRFLYLACQVGAEPALKGEVARRWSDLRFAFSRPGLLTFKLPAGFAPPVDFDPGCVLARTFGFTLERIVANTPGDCADAVWRFVGARALACEVLHVWQRDTALPTQRPAVALTPLALEAAAQLEERRPAEAPRIAINLAARPDQAVLDCILVEPHEWLLGWRRAHAVAARWPGGAPPLAAPTETASRAYLKLQEAVAWSRAPIAAGELVAEIGAAPGGACQWLLERGCRVLAIDPAELSPLVADHPRLTHLRKRGADVRRREFRHVRWLLADANIAPRCTLDTVEAIVTHPDVHIRGLILTLKLLEWRLFDELPAWLERIAGWGYARVAARQLAHNHQEVCVVAQRGAGAVASG